MDTVPNLAPISAMPPHVQQYEPGPIGRRFAASFLDGMVLGIFRIPISFGIGLVMGVNSAMNGKQHGKFDFVSFAISTAFGLVLTYFYFGWFNKNKGATPGKLLLGLRVVEADDGTRLNYGRSFWREISKFTLVIGVFFAIFRKDKRALHDLMANTKVIHQKSA